MRVAVVGTGAVGARCARQLLSDDAVDGLLIADADAARAAAVGASLGDAAAVVPDLEAALAESPAAVVLAAAAGRHPELARRCLDAGVPAVSTSGAIDDAGGLLDLGDEAEVRGVALVAGAAMAPGLSCLLAAHAAGWVDEVGEVHVAYRPGGAGPACTAEATAALGGPVLVRREGIWRRRRGRSAQIVWFPEPVGATSCLLASSGAGILAARAVPGAERVSARIAAPGRRPGWRRSAGTQLAAVHVEVRGRRAGTSVVHVLGAVDHAAVAAGALAALVARDAALGRMPAGARSAGEHPEPGSILRELAGRGVRAAVFDGAEI